MLSTPFSTDGPGDPPPLKLVETIRRNSKKGLERIYLHRHAGSRGYVYAERGVDVVTPEEIESGEEPDTPEEIAQVFWDSCLEHARIHGPAQYKAILQNGEGEEIDAVSFKVTINEKAEAEGVQSRESELLEMAQLTQNIAKDTHKRHMETYDKMSAMFDGINQMSSHQAEVAMNAQYFAYKLRSKEIDKEITQMEGDQLAQKLSAIAGPLTEIGSKLGDFFVDLAKQKTGTNFTGESFPVRLNKIWDSVPVENRDRIIDGLKSIKPDLAAVFESSLKASDDYEFRALAAEFRRLFVIAIGEGVSLERFAAVWEKELTPEQLEKITIILKQSGAFP